MDWWRGSNLGWCCSNKHPVGAKPQAVRRRNRAKHAVLGRKEIEQATSHPHIEYPEWEDCPGNENERNLAFLDFDGVYTV